MFSRIGAGNTGSSVSFHLEGLDIVELKLFKEINSGKWRKKEKVNLLIDDDQPMMTHYKSLLRNIA